MRRTVLVIPVVCVLTGLALAGYAVLRTGPGNRSAGAGASGTGTSASASRPSPLSPDACVAAMVAGMSLEGRVGQLLMVGTPIADPATLSDTIRRYHLGGVFLAGRSSQPAATLRQHIEALQSVAVTATGLRAQIALDQEGGLVQTVKGTDFPAIPSAVQQGQWDTTTLRDRTVDWAGRLAKAGVTMDLAPVADTVP